MPQAREEEHSQPGGPARVERLCEELDDVSRKVEQARDQLSTTMMTFMSRLVSVMSFVMLSINKLSCTDLIVIVHG